MLARLSTRDYVSLSREHRLGISTSSNGTDDQDTANNSNPATVTTPNSLSVFHIGMPGVLSIEEVKENISLEDIDIRLKDRIVNLAVCVPSRSDMLLTILSFVYWFLSGRTKCAVRLTRLSHQSLGEWDDKEMMDPTSLQCIAAEFVACIGLVLATDIMIDLRIRT